MNCGKRFACLTARGKLKGLIWSLICKLHALCSVLVEHEISYLYIWISHRTLSPTCYSSTSPALWGTCRCVESVFLMLSLSLLRFYSVAYSHLFCNLSRPHFVQISNVRKILYTKTATRILCKHKILFLWLVLSRLLETSPSPLRVSETFIAALC